MELQLQDPLKKLLEGFVASWKKTLEETPIAGKETQCDQVVKEAVVAAKAINEFALEIQNLAKAKREALVKYVQDLAAHTRALQELVAEPESKPTNGKHQLKSAPAPKAASDSEGETDSRTWTDVVASKNQKSPKLLPQPTQIAIRGSGLGQRCRMSFEDKDMREFGRGVRIGSRLISDPEESGKPEHRGIVCWCAPQKRFCFWLNGFIFMFCEAMVLTSEDGNVKTAEFDADYAHNPELADKFYHPPELAGGNDRRNFLSSMSYIPGKHHGYVKRPALRIDGDSRRLAEDLVNINGEDMRMNADYFGLMFGCLLALHGAKQQIA